VLQSADIAQARSDAIVDLQEESLAVVSLEAQGLTARTVVPTIDITFGTRMLPFAVRVSAAATDVISFLGLDVAYSPQSTEPSWPRMSSAVAPRLRYR
jgi:hypothetical protein